MDEKDKNNIISRISRYSILQDGKFVERKVIGWKTALAHARNYTTNLFNETKKVEILNIWTGEIIDLQEAEKRAAAYYAAKKSAYQ